MRLSIRHAARPETPAREGAPPSRSPLKFFLLVFALSIPFWLAGGMTDLELMPGLPVSALMAFCPIAAALILAGREGGRAGVTALLRRAFDINRIRAKRWYVPILLLMPGVSLAVYGLMRWMDMPLPAPQFPVLPALLLLLAFFAAGLGEELRAGELQARAQAVVDLHRADVGPPDVILEGNADSEVVEAVAVEVAARQR